MQQPNEQVQIFLNNKESTMDGAVNATVLVVLLDLLKRFGRGAVRPSIVAVASAVMAHARAACLPDMNGSAADGAAGIARKN